MYKYSNNLKYLVACSGGPDSMALLDMYKSNGYYVEVGHVNYHKRDTAKRDEKIVRDYCKKNNIKFHKLDVDPSSVKGNFQAYARKVRYEWFSSLCKKYKLDVVLVAHQEDDFIETYLMQLDKKLGVDTYGLAKANTIYNANVYRPLLNKSKQDLIKYCDNNHIEYGIDESNLTDHYARNRVRHSKVEKLSKKDRKELVKQANLKNRQVIKANKDACKLLKKKSSFTYDELISYPYLRELIKNYFEVKMSDKYIDEIIRQIKTNKTYKLLKNDKYLVKEYGYINLFNKPSNYSFKVKYNDLLKADYFKMQTKGKDSFSCVTVSKSDYPLTIRNVKDGDSIVMNYGTKKLNRFFIDNKIGLQDRLTWPIVCNKDGIAILVPGLGCSKAYYSKNPNLYVLKLSYSEDI